jgi:hypothetical protein
MKLFETKTWKIGDHRVKKTKVPIRGTRGSHKEKKYKCIDCEKVKTHRKDFRDAECFEVVYV